MLIHPIDPVYDAESRILILGSFPSVKSREAQFFYGHPQNRFWQVLAQLCGSPLPQTTAEKRHFLLQQHIAVWDVIGSCEIIGSADSSIKNATANDLTPILQQADIRCIYTNGQTVHKYYNKYLKKQIGRDAVCLPSTSPANAAWSLSKLIAAWQIITENL